MKARFFNITNGFTNGLFQRFCLTVIHIDVGNPPRHSNQSVLEPGLVKSIGHNGRHGVEYPWRGFRGSAGWTIPKFDIACVRKGNEEFPTHARETESVSSRDSAHISQPLG